MRSRQQPVFSGIILCWCAWLHGVDSSPTVIEVTPGNNPNATVTAGKDVVFICKGQKSSTGSWYKVGNRKSIAYMYDRNGNCAFRSKQTLPDIKLGSPDCRDHALEISNIRSIHGGMWKCIIGQENERAIYVHVVPSPAETTIKSTSLSSLTRRVTSESTSHVSAPAGVLSSTPDSTTESTADPATDTTSAGYATGRRTQDSVIPPTPSVTSMTTILGGTVGGALILLAVIILVCCLLRSKKEQHDSGSPRGPVNGDHRHQDPEQREDAGMVDNVLYDSYSGVTARAGGVGQEHHDTLALNGRSQHDSSGAYTYAAPHNQPTSTLQERAAAGDVYSVVQKQPKSEGETMTLQPTDKDAEMSELYSQVQKPQKNRNQAKS